MGMKIAYSHIPCEPVLSTLPSLYLGYPKSFSIAAADEATLSFCRVAICQRKNNGQWTDRRSANISE